MHKIQKKILWKFVTPKSTLNDKNVIIPVVVEYLRKDARMPVEKILIEDGIIIGECFCQLGQACRWYFFKCCFVCLMADAPYVEDYSVFRVCIEQVHDVTKLWNRKEKFLFEAMGNMSFEHFWSRYGSHSSLILRGFELTRFLIFQSTIFSWRLLYFLLLASFPPQIAELAKFQAGKYFIFQSWNCPLERVSSNNRFYKKMFFLKGS